MTALATPADDPTRPGSARAVDAALQSRPRLTDRISPTSEVTRTLFRLSVALLIVVIVLRGDGAVSASTLIVLIAAGLYLVTSTLLAWRPAARTSGEREELTRAIGDVLAIGAISLAAENPHSALLLVLCAIPLGHSLTLSATALAAVSAIAITVALAAWGVGIVTGLAGITDGDLLLVAFALGWSGLISCLIAIERERRANRIEELSGTLQELIGQVITAEETERRRVADLLHDDVLQLLMVTRHDVTDALEGDMTALPSAGQGIDAATRHLRETIGGLRTEGVASQRLGDGIQQLADQAARRRGFAIQVKVAPDLQDEHHPLLLSLGRDLLRDAERNSAATRMTLGILREDDDLVLVLGHDDPRFGMRLAEPEARDAFVAIDQRTRAVGGSFKVLRLEDGRRLFTIRIPARANTHEAAEPRPHRFPGLDRLRSPDGTSTTEHHQPKVQHDVQSR